MQAIYLESRDNAQKIVDFVKYEQQKGSHLVHCRMMAYLWQLQRVEAFYMALVKFFGQSGFQQAYLAREFLKEVRDKLFQDEPAKKDSIAAPKADSSLPKPFKLLGWNPYDENHFKDEGRQEEALETRDEEPASQKHFIMNKPFIASLFAQQIDYHLNKEDGWRSQKAETEVKMRDMSMLKSMYSGTEYNKVVELQEGVVGSKNKAAIALMEDIFSEPPKEQLSLIDTILSQNKPEPQMSRPTVLDEILKQSPPPIPEQTVQVYMMNSALPPPNQSKPFSGGLTPSINESSPGNISFRDQTDLSSFPQQPPRPLASQLTFSESQNQARDSSMRQSNAGMSMGGSFFYLNLHNLLFQVRRDDMPFAEMCWIDLVVQFQNPITNAAEESLFSGGIDSSLKNSNALNFKLKGPPIKMSATAPRVLIRVVNKLHQTEIGRCDTDLLQYLSEMKLFNTFYIELTGRPSEGMQKIRPNDALLLIGSRSLMFRRRRDDASPVSSDY
jgi:hypothetical protein